MIGWQAPGNLDRDDRMIPGYDERATGSVIDRAPSQTERRFLELFKGTPAPGVIIRVSDRQHRAVNDAFVQTFGHKRKDVIGKTGRELGIWQDERETDRLWKKVLAGRSVEAFETQLHTKAGKVVDVLLYAERFELNKEPYVIASIIDITERKRMEEALRVANQQLRVLSRRRGQVQEEERKRLSRELHDHVGQLVTAAKINVQSARGETEGRDARAKLSKTARILENVLEQTRQISFALRPSILDDIGLAPAIRSMLNQAARATGITVNFIADSTLSRADGESEIACYRVATEAVTNVVRHAKAREITIEMHNADSAIQLVVRDNGTGFEMRRMERAPVRDRLGVIGMRERATAVGGSFEINSKPGMGTEVTAEFPLSSAPDSLT
jgi:PAS domain S-box-containing protein